MSRWNPFPWRLVVAFVAAVLCAAPAHAVISVNLKSDPNAVGTLIAGYFPAGNWNDVTSGVIANQPLITHTGAASGLSLSIAAHQITDAGGVAFAAPATAGDSAMMRGHIYEGGFAPVDLSFTGAVPYANYDLIVYFNSSAVTNQQNFAILDSALNPLPGLLRTGFENAGGDASYNESNATTEGNYVRFNGLTAATIPTNFVIRAQGAAGQYAYINGLQFAEAGAPTINDVPPPPNSTIPAISVNLLSNPHKVGQNVAGVVPSTHWNDVVGSTSPGVPCCAVDNRPLIDNVGAATSLTLSVADHVAFNASGVTIGGAGDVEMMTGHIYAAGGQPLDIRIDGAIPFATYDVYVYYNSSGVNNTQTFTLLNSGDLSDTGISATALELAGPDAAYVEGGVGLNGNYVKLSGLNNLDLPSFVIRAQGIGGADQFGYINGIQIVSTVPEPSAMALAALGGLALIVCRRSRR